MDVTALENLRLAGVVASQFTHRSEAPVIGEVWLRFEALTVNLGVAADWELRIDPEEPGEGYVMEELGSRVDVITAPDEVPFVRYIGQRLRRLVEEFDDLSGQRMRMSFEFEDGAVIARSWGGDLQMTHA
ncbi:hypothetical protein AB0K18_21205 [Nonomuraea sp. NPDC049421]|uniref:hypothetical protein n=1 Tax=Nonomuraea sp. NPDC049421 TaxID=3155275 RepID=UPI0034269F01